MKPLVEVVIHDLASNTICYIQGNLSNRRVGDPSLLVTEALEQNLEEIVYPKMNFDGRLVKSISVPLQKKWLVCINCDVSIFNQMQEMSQQLLQLDHRQKPESLFKNDWQEKLHITIDNFIREKGWKFSELKNSQKKSIVEHLFYCGAFHEKNAADYVARALELGRATVFNHLRTLRKKNQ